jgi:uncharacterized protein (TIGR00730 family)
MAAASRSSSPPPIVAEKPYLGSWIKSTSAEARGVRLLTEYLEPMERMRKCGIDRTLLFFGSARALNAGDHAVALADAVRLGDTAKADRLRKMEWMCEWVDKSCELARRLGEWQKARKGKAEYAIATGGGGGMMKAANKGARMSGTRSMGVGISLPFEPVISGYVDKELAFKMHYFSMRKFILASPAWAIVALPGGYGTLDELFELATLIQTGKMGGPHDPWMKKMPIILFGATQYWDKVMNLQAMADMGTVAQADVHRIKRADTIDEAFDAVVAALEEMESIYDSVHSTEEVEPAATTVEEQVNT